MIDRFLGAVILVLFCSVAIAAELPDSDKLPRMPDSYRNGDNKGFSSHNPIGMSVYDAAENEAEEDIFGSVVVPLEESKRIISERKKKQQEGKDKEKNQGENK